MPRTLGHPFISTNRANTAPSLYVLDMEPSHTSRAAVSASATITPPGNPIEGTEPPSPVTHAVSRKLATATSKQ